MITVIVPEQVVVSSAREYDDFHDAFVCFRAFGLIDPVKSPVIAMLSSEVKSWVLSPEVGYSKFGSTVPVTVPVALPLNCNPFSLFMRKLALEKFKVNFPFIEA